MTYNKELNELSDGTKCHNSAKEVWKDGQEVERFKDYNIEPKILGMQETEYAVPITTQSESEDELWDEVHIICSSGISQQQKTELLKQSFFITYKIK